MHSSVDVLLMALRVKNAPVIERQSVIVLNVIEIHLRREGEFDWKLFELLRQCKSDVRTVQHRRLA